MPSRSLIRHDRPMNTGLTVRPAERVVDALVGARLLDPSAREQSLAVIAGVLETSPPATGSGRRRNLPQLVEVVAYLGAALVLAAGALYVVEQWNELGYAAQVTLLAVVSTFLLVAGFVASRVPNGSPGLLDESNDARRRLAGSLLTFGALFAAILVTYVVSHVTTVEFPEVSWPDLAGALTGVVVGAIGYRVAPTAIGMVGTIGGAVMATMTLIDGVDHNEGDAAGLALFLLGAVWLVLAERRWFHESTIARSLGVGVALVGAQVPVMEGTHPWFGYAMTLAVGVVGIWLYLSTTAWPYLAAAVLAVTLVVPEAVSEWSDGSLGAVGGVLVAGVTLLLASFAGYRIRAEATD